MWETLRKSCEVQDLHSKLHKAENKHFSHVTSANVLVWVIHCPIATSEPVSTIDKRLNNIIQYQSQINQEISPRKQQIPIYRRNRSKSGIDKEMIFSCQNFIDFYEIFKNFQIFERQSARFSENNGHLVSAINIFWRAEYVNDLFQTDPLVQMAFIGLAQIFCPAETLRKWVIYVLCHTVM
jgi:hypothetical protein